MKKVFFIGFNKTATTSIHQLFLESGYKSMHHNEGKVNLAKTMVKNIRKDKDILTNISTYHCYSDLTSATKTHYIEGNELFKELYQQYSDSYFVLQTRDTEDWIRSRVNHSNGGFMKRCMTYMEMKKTDEIKEYWRNMKTKREKLIIKYFEDFDRFMVFDIDNDDITSLIDFLTPHFKLKKSEWKVYNRSEDKV